MRADRTELGSPRGAETAFRSALTEALDRLALHDHNLLRFRYFHGLSSARLAEVFCSSRAAIVRQLDRVRARVLRDTLRGIAARLPLDPDELERLIAVARAGLDPAIARVLRG